MNESAYSMLYKILLLFFFLEIKSCEPLGYATHICPVDDMAFKWICNWQYSSKDISYKFKKRFTGLL